MSERQAAPDAGAPGVPTSSSVASRADLPPGVYVMLFLAAATLCMGVYQPALNGGLVSDDAAVLLDNPLVGALTWQNVSAMFDFRVMERDFSANYAPLHDLLVAVERWAFGAKVFPLHIVNVLLHALNSVLLVAWLRSSRLPLAAALLGGLVFALHPANVEAVAWMSQSKTDAALSFSLLALLAFRPAPAAATLLFTAAYGLGSPGQSS